MEKKYVKFISEVSVEYPPINKGETLNYNLDTEQLIKDGYKELIEVQKDPAKTYSITYTEKKDKIIEVATEVVSTLDDLKADKIYENNTKRDEALYSGVIYREILFDSDVDQKVNLLATISTMPDDGTTTWFGMNNEALECTKEDLTNIGSLIVQLHSFCWTKNAELKNAIQKAKSTEELNNVTINYVMK